MDRNYNSYVPSMNNQKFAPYQYNQSQNINLSNFEFNYKNNQSMYQPSAVPQSSMTMAMGQPGQTDSNTSMQSMHSMQNNNPMGELLSQSSVSTTHSPTVQVSGFNQEVTVPGSDIKINSQEIQMLKQLLLSGEKYKWKQITKEINNYAAERNGKAIKNISPTFVVKQYQALLGLPNNQMYFGMLGSSLPYMVHGWEGLDEVD